GQTIYRIAGNVKQTAVDAFTYRHCYGNTGICYFHTAYQAFRAVHRYATYTVFTQVLLHFKHQRITVIALDFQCVINIRQLTVATEIHVNYRTNDLFNFTNVWHIYQLYKIKIITEILRKGKGMELKSQKGM